MVGGPPSVPAPKLVVAGYRPELAALLRPRIVVLIVQADRCNHATQIAVLHVRIVVLNLFSCYWHGANGRMNMQMTTLTH